MNATKMDETELVGVDQKVFPPKRNAFCHKVFLTKLKQFVCGSCHFARATNVEFRVECLFLFFQPTWKSDLKAVVQVILFEIDCSIFHTNLYELICQFISWTNWVNSGKFMDNCWISYYDWKNYKDLIIINLYYL